MKSSASAVFCDNQILVAEKPAGLLTQPDVTCAESLESLMKAHVKRLYMKPGAVFLHAIHRLDKPVSGLVLFARTSKALSRLNESSREGLIVRRYRALIEGKLEGEGTLEHHLVHGEHRALVDPKGKLSRLHYRALEQRNNRTLVEITLETGRYHQIRAQFSAIGHPLSGDTKYGAKSQGEVCLHCSYLAFPHPVGGKQMELASTRTIW